MNDMSTSTEQATVRLERLLPGPIERVWAYLTESDKRATWFAGGTFDLRVGGRADLHFDHSNISSEKTPDEYKSKRSDWPETITRVEPPRLLSYTFGPSKTYSLSTFSHGSSRRLRLSASRSRVKAFSSARNFRRASTHLSCETTRCALIASPRIRA